MCVCVCLLAMECKLLQCLPYDSSTCMESMGVLACVCVCVCVFSYTYRSTPVCMCERKRALVFVYAQQHSFLLLLPLCSA